jgi:hypothetical protein
MEITLKTAFRQPIFILFFTLLGLVLMPVMSIAEEAPKKNDETQLGIANDKKVNQNKRVRAKVSIKASPHIVWETVHEERKHDPDLEYSKVLEQGKNQAVLEQKFILIPIIGTAVCKMHNNEIPLERIDYKLIESDRFKAMEGSWILTANSDGTTILELSSYVDMGTPIPRFLLDNVTVRKLQRRLSNVKKMAEAAQLKLAQTAEKQANK